MSTSVSRSRTISATPEQIFELLAEPARHVEIDGSGTVQSAQPGAPTRLNKGATFGMSMKFGVPYKIENTVVEFEENRRIAWKHFGGHIWRWELAPGSVAGTTDVTETFDWAGARSPLFLKLMAYPARNAKAMEKSLAKLAARFS